LDVFGSLATNGKVKSATAWGHARAAFTPPTMSLVGTLEGPEAILLTARPPPMPLVEVEPQASPRAGAEAETPPWGTACQVEGGFEGETHKSPATP